MIAGSLGLLVCGIAMSAFFSGSETGFYRASRTRLVLDAMEGDRISHRLLFFVNRPTLFVATALVGNNVSNYLVSLSIVLLTRALAGPGTAAEMGASLMLTPLIFVYGELLPKNLYYQAPNRLLRRSAPLFWLFAVLLAPVTALLWILGLGLERLVGQSPTRVLLALAKKELADMLLEGEAAGILRPAQLEMSQNFFALATRHVTEWMTPLADVQMIDEHWPRSVARQHARGAGPNFRVVGNLQTGLPTGYLDAVEMLVSQESPSLKPLIQPLLEIPNDSLYSEVVLMLHANRTEVAGIVDELGQIVGIVQRADLLRPVLGETLESLLVPRA